MSQATGIYRDESFLLHKPFTYHVECPERLEVIYDRLDQRPMDNLQFRPTAAATKEDICLIHGESYFNEIKESQAGGNSYLDPDTYVCKDSFHCAMLAAGTFIKAIQDVMSGQIANGFAFVRPPGHHAESDNAMGFCLFNNVAIGAKYALTHLEVKRVMIIDWDVHHGNGTQHSFDSTQEVLYLSTHRYPFYPGTGHYSEIGIGNGKGYTVNIPLSYAKVDEEYISIFRYLVTPIAKQFKPDLILVSAGFDAHQDDPLGGMLVSSEGFGMMGQMVYEIASEVCGGKLVAILEGGYDLNALVNSSLAVIEAFQGKDFGYSKLDTHDSYPFIINVKEALKTYWEWQ